MSQLRGYTVVTTLSWFYFILYDIVEWFRRREVISSRFPECRYNWGRICEGVDMLSLWHCLVLFYFVWYCRVV